MSLALQGLTPHELHTSVPEVSLGEARKIIAHVQRRGTLAAPIAQVRKVALTQVRALASVPTLELVRTERSALDPFVKHALRTHDGHVVETVRIPLEEPGRVTVCLSSQAGCALACSFCATGRLGLARNLEPWEMIEQVRVVVRALDDDQPDRATRPTRIHGIVFQGMGEPLANLDRVLAAMRVMSEPSALAIDGRNITVCTAGLPSGIRRLAKEAKKARLALSLHSARQEVRQRLMPIAKTHALDDVLAAAVEHAKSTGIAPLWAVTLLAGINDSAEDAQAVAARWRKFKDDSGVSPQLSIIPYNAIGDQDPYRRASDEVTQAFIATLRAHGTPTRLRYSGGGDIGAACGQLAGLT